jgi:pyruvate/2-oxoglutarate dehydrogenase complex dihydrolipoamide acyltransferase (E2) component
MATKILIPKGGMGTTEGTISKWLKAEGDRVTEGEVIVEIETAKALEELAAPVTGTLARILLAEGQTAEVYTEIGVIEEELG